MNNVNATKWITETEKLNNNYPNKFKNVSSIVKLFT